MQSRFGCLEHVKGVIIRCHALHRLYRSRRAVDVVSGICWLEAADRHSYLVSDPRLGICEVVVAHPVRRHISQYYLRYTLDGPST